MSTLKIRNKPIKTSIGGHSIASKQESVREWARLKHSELYDLVDLYPEQVRFVFSHTPDENADWALLAQYDLNSMRDSRAFRP